jgi:3-hydroxyisobutyrate dehydrogenase
MVLEAPVSGGCHRASTGNISILVGGKRIAFEKALPILKIIGFEIVHVGELGKASILKVVTNFLASTHLVAIGEALMVSKKAGIDLGKAYDAIKISSGNSFVHETESQVILSGSYNVNFTMDLVCKDVGLFQKLVDTYGIKTDLSEKIVKIFERGKTTYGSRAWSTQIVKLLEDKNCENLRSDGFPKELIDQEPKNVGREL